MCVEVLQIDLIFRLLCSIVHCSCRLESMRCNDVLLWGECANAVSIEKFHEQTIESIHPVDNFDPSTDIQVLTPLGCVRAHVCWG
jgi:hypothetical protein